jgi:hypothetical protein
MIAETAGGLGSTMTLSSTRGFTIASVGDRRPWRQDRSSFVLGFVEHAMSGGNKIVRLARPWCLANQLTDRFDSFLFG